MDGSDGSGTRGGATAGVLLAGAVCLLALPSAVLAFSTNFEPAPPVSGGGESINPLEAADEAADLARVAPLRSLAKGQLYLFTPARSPSRPDRSVTVAVRLDPQAAKAISVLARKDRLLDSGNGLMRMSGDAFNLGVARGYHNFAQNLVPPTENRKAELPDLTRFSLSPGAGAGDDSRFSPRIVIDEKQAAGRAPRTFAGDPDGMVDVGGAYRVTRNLDVTAGVRYSQDRDRLLPLTTDGKVDSQAVYVGTQFRF